MTRGPGAIWRPGWFDDPMIWRPPARSSRIHDDGELVGSVSDLLGNRVIHSVHAHRATTVGTVIPAGNHPTGVHHRRFQPDQPCAGLLVRIGQGASVGRAVDPSTIILLTAVATVAATELARLARKKLPRWLERRRRLRTMPSFPPAPMLLRRMEPACEGAYREVHERCVFGGVHQHFKLVRGRDRHSAIYRYCHKWGNRRASGHWRCDPRLAARRVHPRRRVPPVPGSAFWAVYKAELDAAVEEYRVAKAAIEQHEKDKASGGFYGNIYQDSSLAYVRHRG